MKTSRQLSLRRLFYATALFVILALSTPNACSQETNAGPVVLWDAETKLLTGFGYRDNILQSSIVNESSAFFYNSMDASLIRMTDSDALFLLYFLGEDIRYSDAPSVNYEQFFSTTARYSRPAGKKNELGLEANYFYMHQILDVSETQVLQRRVLVLGHSLSLMPFWLYTLNDAWSFQAEAECFRQIYEVELDDYWEGSGRAHLFYKYGNRSEISIFGEVGHRAYDTLQQTDETGLPVPGTDLVYQQAETGTEWRHYWDKKRTLRSRTIFSAMMNRDNGGGYFDYNRLKLREQLRWKKDTWQITGNARASWFDYASQTVPGTTEHRTRSTIEIDLGIERTLTDHWLVHAYAVREWNISNAPLDEYNSWSAHAGIGYDF